MLLKIEEVKMKTNAVQSQATQSKIEAIELSISKVDLGSSGISTVGRIYNKV
jgi:hypothetical protein